jgi:hypothetical protein
MAKMHGRWLFTGIEYVKGRFLFDIAPVYEIEHPFRICYHALFIRIWPNMAAVIGWWRKSIGEDKTLLLSLRGKILALEEERERFTSRRELPEGQEEDPEDVSQRIIDVG